MPTALRWTALLYLEPMRDCSWIAGAFANISSSNFKCSSDRTLHLPHNGYNCIAWAAGKNDNWWWPIKTPGAFWPIPIDPINPVTINAFIEAFKTEGYFPCSHSRYENGFEKVAIYVDGDNEPTHAARLLPNGWWTSKLGKYEDIEHETLSSIEGIHYGVALVFLKRRNPLHKKTNHLKILILRLWSRFLPRYFTNLI